MKNYKIIIVGAGPSGIGNAAALQHLELDDKDYLVLERGRVGESFRNWPKEMRFITPSFTGNQFGAVDLNAITPTTSPAFTIKKEHLSGEDYATYLDVLVSHFNLPIQEGVEVLSVKKEDDLFLINTSEGEYSCEYLIWCAGEFQFPDLTPFEGAEHCVHNTHLDSYEAVEGEHQVVIGGYESGIDAAVNFSKLGKKVIVLDSGKPWEEFSSDPSRVLSTYTYERLQNELPKGNIKLIDSFPVKSIKEDNGDYVISPNRGSALKCPNKPILCTGFSGSTESIKDFFEWNKEGHIELTEADESTVTKNLFLSGPMVRHEKAIFCFIYKFRQRFPVIASEIADRMGIDNEELAPYIQANMWLEDLSCCNQECAC